ncbi:Response regulator PleD [Stieleria neptunia]|uniref:Response regulator PleD n=1 Tax=Stieleria neptunia TaxID=2527979 RepID=A0A518HTI2_9BACT|nr:response regulator [Stieleria neptunia]QDV44146.1 Response regulator PleD [Stieleria neptunia]
MSSLISKSPQTRKRPLQQLVQDRLAKRKAGGDGDGWSDPAKAIQTPRILCIDDDPEICRTLEMRLSGYQAEVLVAFFGTQGFWEAITDRPDLILMDVSMPSGDGRFVLESLRNNQATERIPVIVLTGMRDPDLRAEMLALGADSFLHKPIHFDVLLSEMQSYVELSKRPE